MSGWMDALMEGRMVGWIDGIKEWMDDQLNGQMVAQWIHGWTDGHKERTD